MSSLERALLVWGKFQRWIELEVDDRQPIPDGVVLPLAMDVDGDEMICTLDGDPPELEDRGWVFRRRKGCGCDLIYDAEEPPWVTQIRAALRQSSELELQDAIEGG